MVAHVALLLALVLIAAKVGGEIATRLKQPPVLGELLAGMVLGNLPFHFSGELGSNASVDMLSQIGALILLFEVGLESTVRDVIDVGAAASRVAILGTVGSLGAGWLVARFVLPEASSATHVFLAASITATSVGITARVFKDIGQTRSSEARTILGAAVLDDILGLVVLALVSGWIARDSSGPSMSTATSLLLSVGKTAVFLAAALFIGVRFTPQLFALAARLHTAGALLAVGLAFCFFLSWGAEAIGLAPIIGAFAAGLVLEDLHSARFVARGERSLAQQIEPISGFLVPIFFVVMGLRADIRFFARLDTVALAGALTIAAIVGKLFCALGTRSGVRRLAVAIGMMPRGEVTLIFASLGATLKINGVPILDGRGYSALVAVVVLTTILAPISLKWTFASARNLTGDRSLISKGA
jgi:Kef-type K+ transport system membrane component KefB